MDGEDQETKKNLITVFTVFLWFLNETAMSQGLPHRQLCVHKLCFIKKGRVSGSAVHHNRVFRAP